jgi:hypothetical protein
VGAGVALLVLGLVLCGVGLRVGSPHDPFDPDRTGFDLVVVGLLAGLIGLITLVGSAFMSHPPRAAVLQSDERGIDA